MASRYGWSIALSLVAVATVSIPARPGVRLGRAEHRRPPDVDIRGNGPVRALDRPGLTGSARAVSSTVRNVRVATPANGRGRRARGTTTLRSSLPLASR
jgi:hypothetical protein